MLIASTIQLCKCCTLRAIGKWEPLLDVCVYSVVLLVAIAGCVSVNSVVF